MQVSFACTDHGLKAPRANEPTKQNTASPNTASAARARFRTVALIARSLGSFTHRHHISLKESTGKLTGMKYRYSFPFTSLSTLRDSRYNRLIYATI